MADAVVIGAGAGLSTAAGFSYSGERFQRLFGDFEKAYGFHDMYSGGFYPYKTMEEYWAFWSRYILHNRYESQENGTYASLLKLVQNRDYFVLTTNVDHQFQLAGFDKKRLFYTQGDYGLLQCSKPCCAETFDNENAVRAMAAQQVNMRVPSELIPTCPHCGSPLMPNLRADATFVEDEGWHTAAARYHEFLRRHEGLRVVYLELGVGYNTPVIIKYPFWQMTAKNPQVTYVCVNQGEAYCPPDIANQSICLDADLTQVVAELSKETL